MELSASNSMFNQSGIYQLHPTRQRRRSCTDSGGDNSSALLPAMICALSHLLSPITVLEDKNHYLRVAVEETEAQRFDHSKSAWARTGLSAAMLGPTHVAPEVSGACKCTAGMHSTTTREAISK